jgi:hypothetical protein
MSAINLVLCATPRAFPMLWSWALLEMLPVAQLLKNFPTFYGTQRFITMFTRALLHWSLSWARSIQSIPPHPISLRYNPQFKRTPLLRSVHQIPAIVRMLLMCMCTGNPRRLRKRRWNPWVLFSSRIKPRKNPTQGVVKLISSPLKRQSSVKRFRSVVLAIVTARSR